MSDCFIFAYKFVYFVFTESILRSLTIRKSWLTTFVILGFFFLKHLKNSEMLLNNFIANI